MNKLSVVGFAAILTLSTGCDKAAENMAKAVKACDQAKATLVMVKEGQSKICGSGVELPAQAKEACSSTALADLEVNVMSACDLLSTVK